jgi:hypothetical protein
MDYTKLKLNNEQGYASSQLCSLYIYSSYANSFITARELVHVKCITDYWKFSCTGADYHNSSTANWKQSSTGSFLHDCHLLMTEKAPL